jgi:tetratricopeptide (TPR) repeat protein
MEGYFEYIKQTQNFDEVVKYANQFYQEAYRLTNEKQYEAAIEQYTRAIDLMPVFYEAIDNRAFVKMDLGRWDEAIADFELSLTVEPDSVLAVFSIGECHYKMKDYATSKGFFERALAIDPAHVHSRAFLIKAKQLLGE